MTPPDSKASCCRKATLWHDQSVALKRKSRFASALLRKGAHLIAEKVPTFTRFLALQSETAR
jgi:hypothetical protein